MVTRRNRTFLGLVLVATVFSLCAWPAVNVRLATVVKPVPFEEVSILRFLVDAVVSRPQPGAGSTASPVRSTTFGSRTVADFGPVLVEVQPELSDRSNACFGPQPELVKSGWLNFVTSAPEPVSAQSRRIGAFSSFVPVPTATFRRLAVTYPRFDTVTSS